MTDQRLAGKKIAFLVAEEGVEQLELTEPWKAVEDSGGRPELVTPSGGKVQAMNHLDHGDVFDADHAVAEVHATDYDGLVLPGGVANPDHLRMDPASVAFAGDFVRAGRPVAVICHGPWTLVEADVLRGRTVTSWPSLQTDIRNAGGTWQDQDVVVCSNGPGPLVSSRKPDDLPAFCAAVVQQMSGSPSEHPK